MAIFFNVMKVSVLILLIIVAVHGSSLDEEVNLYAGRKTMQKRVKSTPLLRELGFIRLSKMKQSKRRAMTDADRVAPGGPDHMHHNAPPAMR
jgi:hypothetical protein